MVNIGPCSRHQHTRLCHHLLRGIRSTQSSSFLDCTGSRSCRHCKTTCRHSKLLKLVQKQQCASTVPSRMLKCCRSCHHLISQLPRYVGYRSNSSAPVGLECP